MILSLKEQSYSEGCSLSEQMPVAGHESTRVTTNAAAANFGV